MIVNNPTNLDAMQAGRLAQRHYELRQAWKVSRNPDVAYAMQTMADRCLVHLTRTGWSAYRKGEGLVYYYTDPVGKDTP